MILTFDLLKGDFNRFCNHRRLTYDYCTLNKIDSGTGIAYISIIEAMQYWDEEYIAVILSDGSILNSANREWYQKDLLPHMIDDIEQWIDGFLSKERQLQRCAFYKQELIMVVIKIEIIV